MLATNKTYTNDNPGWLRFLPTVQATAYRVLVMSENPSESGGGGGDDP